MENLIGKKVIVRAKLAGVHVGTVVSVDWGNNVIQLENSRRLWRFYTRESSGSLSDVAVNGLRPDASHSIGAKILSTYIQEPDGFEIDVCTDSAFESIMNWETK